MYIYYIYFKFQQRDQHASTFHFSSLPLSHIPYLPSHHKFSSLSSLPLPPPAVSTQGRSDRTAAALVSAASALAAANSSTPPISTGAASPNSTLSTPRNKSLRARRSASASPSSPSSATWISGVAPDRRRSSSKKSPPSRQNWRRAGGGFKWRRRLRICVGKTWAFRKKAGGRDAWR